jgi:hypothetical protein
MRFDFLKRSTHAGKDQAAQRSPACLAKPSRARHDIAQYQSARVFTPYKYAAQVQPAATSCAALLEAELGRHFPPLAIQKSGSLWLRRAA